MSVLKGKKVGVAICASCCTYFKIIEYIKKIVDLGAIVTPIMSSNAVKFNTRFGKAEDLIEQLESITGNKILQTIPDVEPIGPQRLLDVLAIVPCTGNTMAKLSNAIIDTSVTMAAKSMLRNQRPVVISLTSNDALGLNMKNIGVLMETNNVYFVPMGQDNFKTKPNSLSANLDMLIPTIEEALDNKQLQPIIIEY